MKASARLKAGKRAGGKGGPRAEAYRKLHEFNLHIEQAVAALREIGQVKEARTKTKRVERLADYFEEIRADAAGYLASIFSGQEQRVAGRLFRKRRRGERAEDPMDGGWLEEERETKRLRDSRRARSLREKSPSQKKS